jgi:hypothetical protein
MTTTWTIRRTTPMAKRKKGESPRDCAVRNAFACLAEHGFTAALIILPTTDEDRAAGIHLPHVRLPPATMDYSHAYGLLSLAYENAEECGLQPPDDEAEGDAA